MKLINILQILVFVATLVLAAIGGGCSEGFSKGSTSFTIDGKGFFPQTENRKVVLETYTLKPNERWQILILTSQQIWVGVSIMDFELLKKHGADCAEIQTTEGNRSVKSCLEAATIFEPTNDKIELILKNLLKTSLEVIVYVEPV